MILAIVLNKARYTINGFVLTRLPTKIMLPSLHYLLGISSNSILQTYLKYPCLWSCKPICSCVTQNGCLLHHLATVNRGDHNSLMSDIFRSISDYFNFDSVIKYTGCPIKLIDHMAFNSFVRSFLLSYDLP